MEKKTVISDGAIVLEECPEYVGDFYTEFMAQTGLTINTRPEELTSFSPEVFDMDGSYILTTSRYIMLDEQDWAHVPTESIDTHEFFQDVAAFVDDELSDVDGIRSVSTNIDEGEIADIIIEVEVIEGKGAELGNTVMSVLPFDSVEGMEAARRKAV